MHITPFKKNKKGFMVLNQAISLFFAAVIFIGMIWFFYKLQSAIGSEADDGSIANFRRLHNDVKDLLESSESGKKINYFISEDFVVVGFDTNWDSDKSKEEYARNVIFGKEVRIKDSLYRPSECRNFACLCLYKTNSLPEKPEDRDKDVIECIRNGFTDKEIVFSSGGGVFGKEVCVTVCGQGGCTTSCHEIKDSYSGPNEFGTHELSIQKTSVGRDSYTISISS